MSIAKLTIGCSRAGSLGNPVSLRAIAAMWQAAVDAGVRSFDTADIYAQGDSERQLGKLVRANPEAGIEIVTKAGFAHGRKADLVRLAKPFLKPLLALKGSSDAVGQVRASIDRQDFSVDYLSRRFAGSLGRLRMGSVAGFILHDPSPEVLARPEIRAFLDDLKARGLAGATGVSVRDSEAIPAALGMGRLDILQVPVTSYEEMKGNGLLERAVDAGTRVYVRQVLNRPDGKRVSPDIALPPLIEDPAVHSIVLGISRRENLDSTLKHFT